MTSHEADLQAKLTKAREEKHVLAKRIAEKIRAELVCCTIYGQLNDDPNLTQGEKNNLFGQLVLSRNWHDLCYWGEAAARLAEDIDLGS